MPQHREGSRHQLNREVDFRHNFIVEIKSKEQIKELLCKTLPRNSSLPALGPPLIAVKRITLLSQLKISH